MVNFQKQVIERSHTIPVLVDFWAPWCGPCRVLGPTIEQLAEEQKGRWELVKVNTEDQPELAQQYDIMSIPNVKLFHKGEVVNEFVGALPKNRIEAWLNEAIPSDSERELQETLEKIQNLSEEEATKLLQDFLKKYPNDRSAKMALAGYLVFQDPDGAISLVEDIRVAEPEYELAEDIRTLATLVNFEHSNGDPAAGKLAEARSALKNGDQETAMERIIEAVVVDKSFQNDLPRRSAIALFHHWGAANELTRKYRRRFDMALY